MWIAEGNSTHLSFRQLMEGFGNFLHSDNPRRESLDQMTYLIFGSKTWWIVYFVKCEGSMSCISRIQLTLLTLEIKAAVSSKQSDGAFMRIGQPTIYCATLCFTLPFFKHVIPNNMCDLNKRSCLHFMYRYVGILSFVWHSICATRWMNCVRSISCLPIWSHVTEFVQDRTPMQRQICHYGFMEFASQQKWTKE